MKVSKTVHGDKYEGQPVGYCHYYYHSGTLTTNLLKSHNCLGKNCPRLEKNDEHPFWKERDRKLAKKKADQKKRKQEFEAWSMAMQARKHKLETEG